MRVKDRDVYTPKHPSPVAGVPTPIDEELTGKYDAEELAHRRAKRATHDRIARLESKRDEDRAAIHSLEKTVERLCGKLEAYVDTVSKERTEAHVTERARIGGRAKVIVGIATALGVLAGAIATVIAGGCS